MGPKTFVSPDGGPKTRGPQTRSPQTGGVPRLGRCPKTREGGPQTRDLSPDQRCPKTGGSLDGGVEGGPQDWEGVSQDWEGVSPD